MDKGEELHYIPCYEINGKKYTQIRMEDVQSKIEFWGIVVVCYVMGLNLPFFFLVLEGYLKRVWTKYYLESVVDLHEGLFMV